MKLHFRRSYTQFYIINIFSKHVNVFFFKFILSNKNQSAIKYYPLCSIYAHEQRNCFVIINNSTVESYIKEIPYIPIKI